MNEAENNYYFKLGKPDNLIINPTEKEFLTLIYPINIQKMYKFTLSDKDRKKVFTICLTEDDIDMYCNYHYNGLEGLTDDLYCYAHDRTGIGFSQCLSIGLPINEYEKVIQKRTMDCLNLPFIW